MSKMKSKIFLLQIVFFLILINVTEAQKIDPLSVYNSEMKNEKLLVKEITGSITQDTTLCPFKAESALTSLSVSGNFKSFSKKSFLRVILVDSNGDEHLIYECNYLTIDSLDFEFKNEFEETGILDNLKPIFVRIQISKSELSNLRFNYTETLEDKENKIKILKQSIFKSKINQKITQINKRNTILNQKWIAGETSISNMTYSEKKKIFGDSLPNLMGFEYYKGGLFEILDDPKPTSSKLRSSSTPFVSNFDWRNRHGINWNTPVRMQFANSCWAFSAIGATEALVNLYFNKKIDIDLSEGEVVACSGNISNCNGGMTWDAVNFIRDFGVVLQDSFPNNCNTLCSAKNPNQAERILIDGTDEFFPYSCTDPESELKKLIISKGVLAGRIASWGHAMALSGFGTVNVGDTIYTDATTKIIIDVNDTNLIGMTYWIFKNSYGASGWGNGGYIYAIVQNVANEFLYTQILEAPVTSQKYTSWDIVCEDRDGDGYYNWGIGSRPITCPSCAASEEDGDDSDPNLGPMDEYGNLQLLTAPIIYPATSVTTHETFIANRRLCGDLFVESGAILDIEGVLFMPIHSQIIVKNGGVLNVKHGSVIKNTNIKVEAGGKLNLQDNAILEHGLNDEIIIENGAIFDFTYGEIKLIK